MKKICLLLIKFVKVGVIERMIFLARKKHKILNSIICRVSIYMMDNLLGSKKSSEMVLHYKPMFPDVSSIIRMRVVGLSHKRETHIFSLFRFSSLPIISLFSSLRISDVSTMLKSKFPSFPSLAKIISPLLTKRRTFFPRMSKANLSLMFFGFRSAFSCYALRYFRAFPRTSFPIIAGWVYRKIVPTNRACFLHKLSFLYSFIIAFNIICCQVSYSAQWDVDVPTNGALIPSAPEIIRDNNNSLDRLLADYNRMTISYSSATTAVISAGAVTVSNSGGTIRLFLRNTSATNVTFANIDTGGEEGSTTYYIYAIAATAVSETATFKISKNATTPASTTYYKRIGSFVNDGSSNITVIKNDDVRVMISTGTIANAATISVPSGWAADECDWSVGAGTLSDIAGAGAIDAITVSVSSSRVVTCTYNQNNWVDGSTDTAGTCTANFIIGCYR